MKIKNNADKGFTLKLEAAEKMALRLMTKHGLIKEGWTFKFDNATKRLGVTNHNKKNIGLSTNMVNVSPADYVKETILHEIAHALLPPHAGHGASWQRQVERIGGSSARTSDNPFVLASLRPKQKTRTAPVRSTRVLANANAVGIGTKLRLPNGLEVKITNRARVNYHAQAADGTMYTVRITEAWKYAV